MTLHFNVASDISGVILNDGSKAVCLTFTDNETGSVDVFPIHLDIAKDMGKEMERIATVMEES